MGIHGTYGFLFANNTVDDPTGDALAVDSSASSVQIKSNILWAVTGHDITVAPDSEVGFTSDYNDLVTAGGNVLGSWEGRNFTNRIDWFYELNLDQHSITTDPGFIDPAGTANFHVQSTSPTIDAGDPTASYVNEPMPNGGRVNQGFDGNTSGAAPSSIQFLQETSPAGQEKFQVGQSVPITWRSFGISGPADTVKIDLLRDGDPNFEQHLAVDAVDNGSFTWIIPANQLQANDYRVRIEANDGIMPQSTTPETFLITNSGHNYYVNDNSTAGDVLTTAVGNDASSGKSPSQPVASLPALLTAYTFGPGDVIHVDTGTYDLIKNVRLSPADSGVSIAGPATGTGAALFNRGNTNSGAFTFELAGATDVTLDHLAITGAYAGVEANDTGSQRLTVSNSEIFGNTDFGIQLNGYTLTDAHIIDNRVHDNAFYAGISVGSGAGVRDHRQHRLQQQRRRNPGIGRNRHRGVHRHGQHRLRQPRWNQREWVGHSCRQQHHLRQQRGRHHRGIPNPGRE